MMELKSYHQKKQVFIATKKFTIPAYIVDYQPSDYAIRKLMLAINANKRQCSAVTKKRGEVSGGGRKPWRQKGTGNARQGSIRAPQWRGGGIVFGPSGNENYRQKVNKKERVMAIKSAWKTKIARQEIAIIDKLTIKKPRTAVLLKLLANIYSADCLLLVDEATEKNTFLAARNILNVNYCSIRNLSVNIILKKQLILITKAAWAILDKKYH